MTTWYEYTPPTWRNVVQIEGSLRVGIQTCTVVYRQGGVWHNIMTAGMDNPVVRDCDTWVDPTDASKTLLLFFDRPTWVPDSLVSALEAVQQADPSWTPANLYGPSLPIINPQKTGLVFVEIAPGVWQETSGEMVELGAGAWTDPTGTLAIASGDTWSPA